MWASRISELQSSDFRTRVREKEAGGAALWDLHDPLTAGFRAVLPSLHGLRYQQPLRKRNQSCFERSIITGIKITAVSAATSSYFIKTRLLVEEQRKSRSAESDGRVDKLHLLPKATICHSNCIK